MADTKVYATDYPKWMYDGEGHSQLVNSPVEEKELGDGWQIHPDKAKAEHIKKVAELQARSDEEKRKIDEKFAQDKANEEKNLSQQLEANSPEAKKKAAAKAAADKEAAKVAANNRTADQQDEAQKKDAAKKDPLSDNKPI